MKTGAGDGSASGKNPADDRHSSDRDIQKMTDNTRPPLHYNSRPYYNTGHGPPRNMDELSDLIFGMREDIYTLKDKQRRDFRKHRRSSSFSRSRSRERGRFRSSSRSRSRSRDRRSRSRNRHYRARARSRRARRRSYTRSRSPARYRERDHSANRSLSRSPDRYKSQVIHKKPCSEHQISDSEDDLKNPPQQKELGNQLNDDPDNPFCGYVKQIAVDSKVGDPVDSWVAQFIEKALSAPPSKEVLTEICEKYKRPENVVNLQVPAVEPAVWQAISSKARTRDNLRQKQQETFVKLLIAISSAANDLNNKYMMDQKSENPRLEWLMEPLGKLKDALVVGGFHNMQDIIKRRRYDLEFFMPEKYRRLCTDFNTFPPTPTALLGENIEDAVKQMDLTNKLSQKLDKNSKLNNNRPNQGNSSGSYHKKGQNFKNQKKNNRGNNQDSRPVSNSNQNPNHNQDRNRNKSASDFRKGGPRK